MNFFKRLPNWLQFSLYVVFVICVFVIALKLISIFKGEKNKAQVLVAPTLDQFKQVDKKDWTKENFDMVKKALSMWTQRCPAYVKFPDEATLQQLSIKNNDSGTYDSFGWKDFVRVEVVAAQHPYNLMKISHSISGHHCFYDIGNSHKAGMWVAKTACIKVCGGEHKDHDSLGKFFKL